MLIMALIIIGSYNNGDLMVVFPCSSAYFAWGLLGFFDYAEWEKGSEPWERFGFNLWCPKWLP